MDKYDIPFIIKNINDDMPIHTDSYAKIKGSHSKRFPKNLMDYSEKIDNGFINDNLAVIEELNHKDPKNYIPLWFREYQNKIYGKSEILNHDNFFKATLNDIWKKCFDEGKPFPKVSGSYRSMSVQNVAFLAIKKTNGSDIITASGGSDLGSFGNNNFQAFRLQAGIVGQYYDRISMDIGASVGNVKFACYDNSGTSPTNLYQQTASMASFTGYTWKTLTEFALSTVVNWACFNNDNNGMHPKDTAGGASDDRFWQAEAIGTSFTSTAPTITNFGTDRANMKIGHS